MTTQTQHDDGERAPIDDRELLTRVDGVGEETVDRLLDHFGHGYWVAQSAGRYWGELAKIDGFSEERAKSFFDAMHDADVYDTLNSDRALLEALDQGHRGDDHGGGA